MGAVDVTPFIACSSVRLRLRIFSIGQMAAAGLKVGDRLDWLWSSTMDR